MLSRGENNPLLPKCEKHGCTIEYFGCPGCVQEERGWVKDKDGRWHKSIPLNEHGHLDYTRFAPSASDDKSSVDNYDMITNLKRENASLRGHIRRLEKSNQELGEELHRCQNPEGPKGWD